MRFSRPLLFFLLLTATVKGQHVLRGRVRDAESNEALPGAAVSEPARKRGIMADSSGFFRYETPSDTGWISISYAGFRSLLFRIETWGTGIRKIELWPTERREVVVTSEKSAAAKVQSGEMSAENLSAREARLLPALFGEVDILKTLQLKPGVQSGGEGFSGLYVRGGGPDQNLMLIDGATVYNPNHLFGFLSVFNADAVSGIDLYKGAFPARFNGRLSSVVDIRMREGRADRFQVSGGIGLISSRLSAEGPVLKNKASFIVSARRTYFDVFTRMYNRSREGSPRFNPIPDYYFQDFNTKLTWKPGPSDKITLTAYHGRDVFTFRRNPFSVVFDWGNTTANLRWQRELNRRWALNTQAIFTDYNYLVRNRAGAFTFQLGSGIRDYTVSGDITYTPSRRSVWHTGLRFNQHQFSIARASARSSDNSFRFSSGGRLRAQSASVFLSNETDLSEKWKLNTGMVFSGFLGSGRARGGLEPRLSLRYAISSRLSLKASYTRMVQYLHLISNSGASLPTDLWYPSNQTVRPQTAGQTGASWAISLLEGKLFFSHELYYKKIRNQTDLRDGASFFVNNQLDTSLAFGRGRAWGTEFYLEKKKGKLTGWIGYTLSYTTRQFAELNFGEPFFPRHDRRHDVSVVAMYALSPRVSLSTTWVFGSGNAISLPEARFFFQDIGGTTDPVALVNVVPLVRRRNTFRMEPYHRWDIGLVLKLKPARGESDLTFSVYNAYNRMNPFFIYFETLTAGPDGSGPIVGFRARQVSLFPVIPSVSYNFRF